MAAKEINKHTPAHTHTHATPAGTLANQINCAIKSCTPAKTFVNANKRKLSLFCISLSKFSLACFAFSLDCLVAVTPVVDFVVSSVVLIFAFVLLCFAAGRVFCFVT